MILGRLPWYLEEEWKPLCRRMERKCKQTEYDRKDRMRTKRGLYHKVGVWKGAENEE